MLNYDVFEAFKSAGADEDKARKAAEALTRDHDWFVRIDERFTKVEAKLDLHGWMLGAVIAMNIAILVRLLVSA